MVFRVKCCKYETCNYEETSSFMAFLTGFPDGNIIVCARAAPKGMFLPSLSCQAFARLLLAGLELLMFMEQQVSEWYSIMIDIRAFSAHLLLYYCCGPLLLFGSSSNFR